MREDMITIDRIEGEIAVCERANGDMTDIPLKALPRGVQPGDVLSFRDGVYAPEPERRGQRRELIRELERQAFE